MYGVPFGTSSVLKKPATVLFQPRLVLTSLYWNNVPNSHIMTELRKNVLPHTLKDVTRVIRIPC